MTSHPLGAGEWFLILDGQYAGRWHLSAWGLHARLGVSSGDRDDGWLAFASCPRCYAMVLNSTRAGAISPEMWGHENWHAATDHPRPAAPPGTSPDPPPAGLR